MRMAPINPQLRDGRLVQAYSNLAYCMVLLRDAAIELENAPTEARMECLIQAIRAKNAADVELAGAKADLDNRLADRDVRLWMMEFRASTLPLEKLDRIMEIIGEKE